MDRGVEWSRGSAIVCSCVCVVQMLALCAFQHMQVQALFDVERDSLKLQKRHVVLLNYYGTPIPADRCNDKEHTNVSGLH